MGEFAKWAAPMLKKAKPEEVPERPRMRDWRERSADQQARFRKHMPTTQEESTQRSIEAINQIKQMMHQLGYNFRMQRHMKGAPEQDALLPKDEPGIPGRDISISLPKSAEWLDEELLTKDAIGPIGAFMQNRAIEAKAKLKEKKRQAFQGTSSPLSNPIFGPAAVITAPEAFREGFNQADEDAKRVRSDRLDAELENAKADFERALEEEYAGRKSASAGEWIDELAGLLIKKSDDQGVGSKVLNTYLTLAALLGYGSHRAAKSFTSKHDPSYQKQYLTRMALRQKMHERGVPILVDYGSLPAARKKEEEERPVESDVEMPFFEAKEAAADTPQVAFRQLSKALRNFKHHISDPGRTNPLRWRDWYNVYSPEKVQAWEKLLNPKVRQKMLEWALRH